MMNLVSRCLMCYLPLHQKAPVKTRHESQFHLSPQTEQHYRTERPVVYAYSSSYSEWNIVKTWSSQDWQSVELMEGRTGRPVVTAQHTDRFIVENDKITSQTRFSREHKNVILEEGENHDRTERLVVCPQRGAPQHFVIEDDEAESDLSLESRSFLHRVNDQARKRQNQSSKDATKDSDKHSVIW